MATYEEFTIDQGTDVAIEIHMVDASGNIKNLANHSIHAQLSKSYNSSDSSIAFNAIVATPPEAGIATISLTNTQTSALKKGRYVYDVELSFIDSSSTTIIERILEGRVQILPGVTNANQGQGGSS